MKHNNICYAPVNDCGGFGGNWYWNPLPPPPISIANPMGLFALGYANGFTNATNIYTYSTNIITTGSNLLGSAAQGLGGAGNAQLAVLQAVIGTTTGTNSIYVYSRNTVTTGGVFYTNNCYYGSASGNSTLGIFAGTTNPTDTTDNVGTYQSYIYSSNVVAITLYNVTLYNWGRSSTGTSTFGLFNLGGYGTSQSFTKTVIYMYATNSISYGTNIFNGVMDESFGNAAGNATMGVFNAGVYNNGNAPGQFPLNIYMYSTNSVTTGVSLSAPSGNGGATGNDLYGVFSVGNTTNTTNIYKYSNNTINVGANLTLLSQGHVATSNHNPGVNS